jgi:predicted metalloprotease with PDZ domain
VQVVIPEGWRIVTGLERAGEAEVFTADGAERLVDSPMLVGDVHTWRFAVDGVSHGVSYLGVPGGVPFDTARFVSGVERFAREAVRMFGRMPYERYEFLFEDDTYGGLEHANSVSIGARSADLARDPDAQLRQVAHEFFHTWNEVHLRPAAWIGIRHQPPEPTGELWWAEGVTLYYADLLARRAGLLPGDSGRAVRTGRLLAQYLNNPSNAAVSPEATSRAFNRPPGSLGDWTPSMFTQGETLGAMLDAMIREGSGGARTLDDAMRALVGAFSLTRGFTNADVERAVAAACACDARPFFDRHVRGAAAPDFGRWLGAIGLRAELSWAPALSADGTPAPDLRFSANSGPGGAHPLLNVWFPAAPLGRAGFHTGDVVEQLNGVPVADVPAFREIVGRLRIGDTLQIVARRGADAVVRTIRITGYERPVVRVEPRPDATPAQRRLLAAWMANR